MYKGMRKWQPFQLSLPGAVGGRVAYRSFIITESTLSYMRL
jgi:hypothetical protein